MNSKVRRSGPIRWYEDSIARIYAANGRWENHTNAKLS
jgi:hypothetical protein